MAAADDKRRDDDDFPDGIGQDLCVDDFALSLTTINGEGTRLGSNASTKPVSSETGRGSRGGATSRRGVRMRLGFCEGRAEALQHSVAV